MKPISRTPLTFQRTGPPAKLVKAMPKRKTPSDIEEASRQIALAPKSFDPTTAEIKPDKITLAILDETLSDDQKEVVIQFFKDRVNKKNLHSLPAKGTGFNRRYVKKYDDGFTLEFRLDPSRRDHNRQFMNFTFNPGRMKRQHARSLQKLMERLFPGYWLKVVKELRLYRFDVCVDLPVDNDRLIVRRGRSVSGVKYVIAHNRFGRIESQYFGSIDSDEHGVAYDQRESDKYKREVGELPTLSGEDAQASQKKKTRTRTRPRDNAELIIDGKRTRFEARRIFKNLPKVDVLQTWDGPFDNWEVWEISETMKLKNDALFWMYLDCVRWRGVAGANLFLKFHGFKELPKMEKTLELLKTDWWEPQQFRMSVIKSLKKCGLWQFLTQ